MKCEQAEMQTYFLGLQLRLSPRCLHNMCIIKTLANRQARALLCERGAMRHQLTNSRSMRSFKISMVGVSLTSGILSKEEARGFGTWLLALHFNGLVRSRTSDQENLHWPFCTGMLEV